MKICLSIFFVLGLSNFLIAQIEVMPFMRWDTYPKFTYAINSVTTNEVKINSISWGMNTSYKFLLHKKIYLKPGLGYYRYSFNKISQINSMFGKSNGRVIDYQPPGPIAPALIYRTNKYFYHTISLSLGFGKGFSLKNSLKIDYGVLITNYYSISQYYHIKYPQPDGTDFRKNVSRYFGVSASINTGIKRSYKKVEIGPTLIIPIFDLWKKDVVFPQEENNESRNKWSQGVGIGMQIIYALK